MEIDKKATTELLKKLSPQDSNLLRVVQSGSMWTKSKLAHTGEVSNNTCECCTEGNKQTPEHVLWRCKAFEACRKCASPSISSIPVHALPKPLLFGIAPAMMADPCKTYWGFFATHLDESIQETLGKVGHPCNNPEASHHLHELK